MKLLRVKCTTKLLIICVVSSFILFLIISLKDSKRSYGIRTRFDGMVDKRLKYILLWTDPKAVPFVYMREGQKVFQDKKCPHTNCYVTSKRTLLGDYTNFDVIAFSGPQIVQGFVALPSKRSPQQKYVFASIESSDYYPICTRELDSFFNWTWTYKLESDARWGYVAVRDANGKVIGPNKVMHWLKLEDMSPVQNENLEKLKLKSKAAAWFVSNCITMSRREEFVSLLKRQLKKYGLFIDIYGGCGQLECPRNDMNDCSKLIENDYYFYLAFENSNSEDYVTEKLLHGLKHYAVPIVFGGANYSRFMPDGIYLDAKELGAKLLAETMNEIINDQARYEKFFRWHNHYKYYRRIESIETDDYCRFCSMLNDDKLVKATSIYKDFKTWWTPPGKC